MEREYEEAELKKKSEKKNRKKGGKAGDGEDEGVGKAQALPPMKEAKKNKKEPKVN